MSVGKLGMFNSNFYVSQAHNFKFHFITPTKRPIVPSWYDIILCFKETSDAHIHIGLNNNNITRQKSAGSSHSHEQILPDMSTNKKAACTLILIISLYIKACSYRFWPLVLYTRDGLLIGPGYLDGGSGLA